MATKHYCDVCGEEERDINRLREVSTNLRGTDMRFDLCEGCATKMFKPVKSYHSSLEIVVKFKEK